MNKLYRVLQDEASWENFEGIIARHQWGLPGVKCPACGETWAQDGLAYPSVDLSDLPGEVHYRSLWPVTLEIFEERRQAVLRLIPDGFVPPPGTVFGPLVGKARGLFGDFAWTDSWTLLARPEALAELGAAGVRLPKTVRAVLTIKKANVRELFELELEPRTLMDPSALPSSRPQCKACGRDNAKMPEKIVIQESSIPSDVDIFRDQFMTTLILATERFVETVTRLKLTGAEFREVKVV